VPLGEDSATMERMELERFCTVTPCWRTCSGRRASAADTRLLTSIVAWSGSVPMSKYTDSRIEPASELADRM
jgi:hypothetical protein